MLGSPNLESVVLEDKLEMKIESPYKSLFQEINYDDDEDYALPFMTKYQPDEDDTDLNKKAAEEEVDARGMQYEEVKAEEPQPKVAEVATEKKEPQKEEDPKEVFTLVLVGQPKDFEAHVQAALDQDNMHVTVKKVKKRLYETFEWTAQPFAAYNHLPFSLFAVQITFQLLPDSRRQFVQRLRDGTFANNLRQELQDCGIHEMEQFEKYGSLLKILNGLYQWREWVGDEALQAPSFEKVFQIIHELSLEQDKEGAHKYVSEFEKAIEALTATKEVAFNEEAARIGNVGQGSDLSQLALALHEAASRLQEEYDVDPLPIWNLLHQLFFSKEGPTKHQLFLLFNACCRPPTTPIEDLDSLNKLEDLTSLQFEQSKDFNNSDEFQTKAGDAKAIKDEFTRLVKIYFSKVWKGDDERWTNKQFADIRNKGEDQKKVLMEFFANTVKIKLADPSLLMPTYKKLVQADVEGKFEFKGIYVATLKKGGKKNVGLLLLIQTSEKDRDAMMNFLCAAKAPKFNSFPVTNEWVLLARQTEDARLFVNPCWKVETETRKRTAGAGGEKAQVSKRRNIRRDERVYQKESFSKVCDLLLPKLVPIDLAAADAPRVDYDVQIFDGASFQESPRSMTNEDGTLAQPLPGYSYVFLGPMETWV